MPVCRKCGTQAEKRVELCPQCGAPFREKLRNYEKWIILGALGWFALVYILLYQSFVTLKINLKFTGGEFIITNSDNFAWKNVMIDIDGGYIMKLPVMAGGGSYTFKSPEFAKVEGYPLDIYRIKQPLFILKCDTPRGKGRAEIDFTDELKISVPGFQPVQK